MSSIRIISSYSTEALTAITYNFLLIYNMRYFVDHFG